MWEAIHRLLVGDTGAREAAGDYNNEKDATDRTAFRKRTYKTWDCSGCSHSYFYQIIRCPLCGSQNIEELSHPVRVAAVAFQQTDHSEK